MAIRPVLRMGDPRLLEQARPVERFDTPELHALIADMNDTMHALKGAGLAAPQIGVGLQVVIFGVDANPRYPDVEPVPHTVLVNPVVTFLGTDMEEGWEGCLSVPGFNATVVRPSRAVVRGLDRHGVPHQTEGTDLLARAFQHEMDHLDGTLFVDRLRGLQKDLIVRKIKKFARAGKW